MEEFISCLSIAIRRGRTTPQGIHGAIWPAIEQEYFALPATQPLTLAAYSAGAPLKAFIEPRAVGETLTDMPIFLTIDQYLLAPLDATYTSAWEAVPAYWQSVVRGERDHFSPQ